MSYQKKSLTDLIDVADSAWPLVQNWISQAVCPVETLAPAETSGKSLVAVQVTTRSPMGAIIYHTGGLLIDHGWLRILGSGHSRLPRSLPSWNFECGMVESDTPPPWLLIADDVLGGLFALNGGHFGEEQGVWYFAPDTLEWEALGIGYSGFLEWCMSGKLNTFYEPFRWMRWEDEIIPLGGDQVLFIYPPLSAEGPSIEARRREPVPITEVFKVTVGTI